MMSKPKVPLDEDIRREIVALARRKHARAIPKELDRPTNWQPNEVINPESGMPFSREGAWHFIARCAEEGHEIETVPLRKPEGKTAYVMKIQLQPSRPRLYVKVEVQSGRILGRSFHESRY